MSNSEYLEGRASVIAAIEARRRTVHEVLVARDAKSDKVADVLAAASRAVPVRRVEMGRDREACPRAHARRRIAAATPRPPRHRSGSEIASRSPSRSRRSCSSSTASTTRAISGSASRRGGPGARLPGSARGSTTSRSRGRRRRVRAPAAGPLRRRRLADESRDAADRVPRERGEVDPRGRSPGPRRDRRGGREAGDLCGGARGVRPPDADPVEARRAELTSDSCGGRRPGGGPSAATSEPTPSVVRSRS